MFLEPQIVSQRHGLVTKGRIYKDKPFRYQPNWLIKVSISNNAKKLKPCGKILEGKWTKYGSNTIPTKTHDLSGEISPDLGTLYKSK